MKSLKVPFNQDIEEEIKEAFGEQVSGRGYVKYRAVTSAVKCFMALPSEVQVKLMSCKNSDVGKILADCFREADTREFFQKIPAASRAKVLKVLREALKDAHL